MDNIFRRNLALKINEGSPFTIFFLGLAKNTGKTTALNYVYSLLQQYQHRIFALMSTGYDGEDVDALTGLPKPHIAVAAQHIAVTSERLIQQIDPSCFTVLKKFRWSTAFGQIVIVRALVDFEIPLVSPGTIGDIEQVLSELKNIEPKIIILVDGSINRKAFLRLSSTTDMIVLSTGGAFTTDFQTQVNHLTLFHWLFSTPIIKADLNSYRTNLLDDQSASDYHEKRILIPDASCIFLSPDGHVTFLKNRNELFVEKELAPIGLVTVNSFNPFGDPIDFSIMVPELRKIFGETPVIDIFKLEDAEA